MTEKMIRIMKSLRNKNTSVRQIRLKRQRTNRKSDEKNTQRQEKQAQENMKWKAKKKNQISGEIQ